MLLNFDRWDCQLEVCGYDNAIENK